MTIVGKATANPRSSRRKFLAVVAKIYGSKGVNWQLITSSTAWQAKEYVPLEVSTDKMARSSNHLSRDPDCLLDSVQQAALITGPKLHS